MKPINLSKVRTISIRDRKSKVQVGDFAATLRKGAALKAFISALPNILAGADFKAVVQAVVNAHRKGKPVIFGFGAHLVKCGLSPLIVDFIRRGVITGVALNGAGVIHDFELAYAGHTSEDVGAEIGGGRWGMTRETAEILNGAINQGVKNGLGIGEAVGKSILKLRPRYLKYSILAAAAKANVPATVHVAIGTDTLHMHPSFDGASTGKGSQTDFLKFAGTVAELNGGGVYLNIGSAVILPEVFAKAVNLARNLGYRVNNFTTVNFDFIPRYRELENVVRRPVAGSGKGYSLIGHHEIMIPLLYQAIIEEIG